MHRLRFLLLLIVAVAIISCDPSDWSFDEATRTTSPSGKVDAVLVERDGGATTSFGYNIYVVPKGKAILKSDAEIARLYGAVRSEQAYGVNLKWDGENNLVTEYLKAQNSELVRSVITVAGEKITLTLHPNINDPSAPAGGMLYNLEKNR